MTNAYRQGFIKRANELGFDGAALLKYAASSPPSSRSATTQEAIGPEMALVTVKDKDTGKVVPALGAGSYAGQLLANANPESLGNTHSLPGWAVTSLAHGWGSRIRPERWDPITSGSLAMFRDRQASENLRALKFYARPSGSTPSTSFFNRLFDNLINAGKQNAKAYTETGTVPKRTKIDRTGIEDMELNPEAEALLLEMQNTMAHNKKPSAARTIA